jgi:DNA-binding CsgD family transcriptional regulator
MSMTSRPSVGKSSKTPSEDEERTCARMNSTTPSRTSWRPPGKFPGGSIPVEAGRSRLTPTRFSGGGTSTSSASSRGGPNGSFGIASTKGPGRRSSASTPPTATVAWEKLSPRGRAILRQIAVPLSLGYSPAEISATLGISSSYVSGLLAELQGELDGTLALPRC